MSLKDQKNSISLLFYISNISPFLILRGSDLNQLSNDSLFSIDLLGTKESEFWWVITELLLTDDCFLLSKWIFITFQWVGSLKQNPLMMTDSFNYFGAFLSFSLSLFSKRQKDFSLSKSPWWTLKTSIQNPFHHIQTISFGGLENWKGTSHSNVQIQSFKNS